MDAAPLPVTRSDVERAHEVIRGHVRRTPVIEVAAADLALEGAPVTFKLEQLQHTGSFKARGASYSVMTGDVPEAGVVAASGGNHGAALAWAAQAAGVPANVFVFSFTPQAKADRIRAYGATVHDGADGFDALMEQTLAFRDRTGALLVHAYDQPRTLAGQGTVAAEFLDQAPVDTLLVAVGGGGLIGGIAAYVEDRVKIVSVEPERAPTLRDALAAGRPVPSPAGGIAADSLGPGQVGALVFPIAQRHVDLALTVTETAIHDAWRLLWDRLRLVVEPGGAVALAALTSGAYRPAPDERVGVLLCGANTGIVGVPRPAMKIASFNINGIRARIEALLAWLDEATPDVALLQEIKCVDEAFPVEPFADRGYNVEVHGQKGFNGVAILSKLPLEDVSRGLPGDDSDDHARWIEATVIGRRAVRVCGLYLPNGNPAPGPKYDYKLAWMARLHARATALLAAEEAAVLAGDWNVIPQDEDAARPDAWRRDALGLPETRAAFRRVLNLGYTDAFRARVRGPGHYSFWDYQAGAFDRNDGIRIDHLLLTPQAADLMTDVGIDAAVRGRDKPSDHVPVWITLDA